MKPHRRACDTTSSFANADATANHIGKLYFELYLKKKRVGFFLIWSLLDQPFWWCVLHTTNYAFFDHLLSPFYHKTGTMGRIGSTSYVLPIWLSYRTLNRAMRVPPFVDIFYLIMVDKKPKMFDYLPPFSSKGSLWATNK